MALASGGEICRRLSPDRFMNGGEAVSEGVGRCDGGIVGTGGTKDSWRSRENVVGWVPVV